MDWEKQIDIRETIKLLLYPDIKDVRVAAFSRVRPARDDSPIISESLYSSAMRGYRYYLASRRSSHNLCPRNHYQAFRSLGIPVNLRAGRYFSGEYELAELLPCRVCERMSAWEQKFEWAMREIPDSDVIKSVMEEYEWERKSPIRPKHTKAEIFTECYPVHKTWRGPDYSKNLAIAWLEGATSEFPAFPWEQKRFLS